MDYTWTTSPWNSPGQNTGVGSHSLLQGNLLDLGMESWVSCIAGRFLTLWATREALKKEGLKEIADVSCVVSCLISTHYLLDVVISLVFLFAKRGDWVKIDLFFSLRVRESNIAYSTVASISFPFPIFFH